MSSFNGSCQSLYLLDEVEHPCQQVIEHDVVLATDSSSIAQSKRLCVARTGWCAQQTWTW